MDFITVFTTLNPAEASLIASQLEAAGFEPTVRNEASSITFPPAITAQGIQVVVPAGQAEEAKLLLDQTVKQPSPGPAT